MSKSEVIEISSSSTQLQSQSGFVVTLEGTNLLLTCLVTFCALLGIVIKIVTKFNSITSDIADLKQDLHSHSNTEGHTRLLEQVRILQTNLHAIDKKIDLHLLDYVHSKDATLLHVNGVSDNVKHVWEKTEKILVEQKADIKELQKFLNKHQAFKIRE